jgi:hypothetical protein
MAVYDSYAGSASAYQTTFSLSHTIGSGSNRIALLCLNGTASDRVPGSVQYGSTAATKLYEGASSIALMRVFYVLNPPTGTANWTRTDSGAGWDILFFEALAFSGVFQSASFYRDYDYNAITGFQPTATITLTTISGDKCLAWGWGHNQNGTISGTGTDVQEYTGVVGTWYCHSVQSYATASTTSQTMNVSGGWGTTHTKAVWGLTLIDAPSRVGGPGSPSGFSPNNDIGRQSKLRRRQRWGYS